MNPRKSPPPGDANEEVAALIETLHETGQRLEELTAGEVDTVADRDGRTFLLRHAQDQLRHSDAAKQTAILNALPAHIALLDTQGFIISVNEAWRRFACADTIQGPGHEIGRNYLEICDSARGDDSSEGHQVAEGIRSVLGGGVKSFSIEYPCHSPTEQRWFLLTVTPLADDHPHGAVVMHLNITERKRATDALRESRARLEALTRRLLESQETERRAIARELHDEVGGVLTAVKLNLQSLRGKCSGDPGEAALADGLALVDGAIQSVRSLSLDLRPAVLDDLGLIPALKWYCARQAQRAGIPIELALDAIDLKSMPQLESACFRIVQESVTNALRHASAHRIQVALRRGDDSFVLEVADDGGGFDVAAARERGLVSEGGGLHGMEERTKLLGGRLSVDSAPGAGSLVRAEFGLPEEGSS